MGEQAVGDTISLIFRPSSFVLDPSSLIPHPSSLIPHPLSFIPSPFSLILHPSSLILLVWLFAVGGAIGSFLNVVAYRLPLGMSLIAPGSHCPACKHPIRWYDNVPILGWILLRGRCRDCRAPISMRYPLVEAITAALFLVVGIVEGLSFGSNLPVRPRRVIDGVIFARMTAGETLGIVAYHLLLLATLLAAALIEYDGRRLPLRLFWPAILLGGAAPIVWPHLHPVPALALLPDAIAAPLDGMAGFATGLVMGHAARWILGPRDRRGLPLGLAVAGLFLGWQAILVLGLVVAAIHGTIEALHRWPRWRGLWRTSPGVWLLLGTTAWILAWGRVVGWWPVLAVL